VSTDAQRQDSNVWQHIQAMLDSRISFHMQNMLGPADAATRAALLKLCNRCLLLCARLPQELRATEPFLSFAQEFTSLPWVHGIVHVMEDTKTHFTSDVFIGGLRCLYTMATCAPWTRHWPTCDVLPFMLHSKKRMTGHPNTEVLRRGIDRILRSLSVTNHAYINATVASGALGGKALTSEREIMTNPLSVDSLLAEANDLAFGSTMTEQAKFSDSMFRWMHSVLPSDSPSRRDCPIGVIGGKGEFWKSLTELTVKISGWLPAMSLSLDLDERNKERKERAYLCCDVMTKQIAVLERVMLYALVNADDSASRIITSIIAPGHPDFDNEGEESPDLLSTSSEDTGLLAILRHLDISASSIVEGFLPARVQIQIVSTLSKVIARANSIQLQALCRLNVVGCCVQFMKYVVSTMRTVAKRPALFQEFNRLHGSLVGASRGVWQNMLESSCEDVFDALCDTEVLKVIVCDWLPDTCNLGLQTSGPKTHDALIVRFEALCLIRAVVAKKDAIEKIAYTLTRFAVANAVVSKEITNLKSTSTRKGTSLLKAGALEALVLFAEFNAESIHSSMDVRYICDYD
jgi:hypothetical protein